MPLIKQLTEAAISAELDHPLSSTEEPNRKNGKDSKTIKTSSGCALNSIQYETILVYCRISSYLQTMASKEVNPLKCYSNGFGWGVIG